MNHVAHCLLSVPDPEVLFGNFIGDFIKGRAWIDYTTGVQRGIHLHRRMDAFTDSHPDNLDNVRLFRPLAGRYAGAFMDIINDHLLCRYWHRFHDKPFDDFADWVFGALQERHGQMPEPLHSRWPRMLEAQFLYVYADQDNLRRVLSGFAERHLLPVDTEKIVDLLQTEQALIDSRFLRFFPELLKESRLL